MSGTALKLASQWENPSDVTTVLMVIGGDVVQKALAQTTGCWYSPVCFSFGWVAYTFMALVNVIGDGRLLPAPDYPVKVFNLESGYSRENRNWVIGRLVRDNEAYMSREEPMLQGGIRISVWEARPNPNRHTRHSYSRIHLWGFITTVIQLAIASIPVILHQEWGILLITGAGTLLALVAGGLPQWGAEKLPNRQHSKTIFALTAGNGSKDIMVINGNGECLDLEELSAQDTPRNGKPWEKFSQEYERRVPQKFGMLAQPQMGPKGTFRFNRTGTQFMTAKTLRGLPAGFWITLCVCGVESVLWLFLLITVAALTTDTWFLIVVGGMGMFQNAYVAAMERSPEHRNVPLKRVEVITRKKVMDGLMDLEVGYACGGPLVNEFFPGRLREEEEAWWRGERKMYDEIRSRFKSSRGAPRSEMPNFVDSKPFKPMPAATGMERKGSILGAGGDLTNRAVGFEGGHMEHRTHALASAQERRMSGTSLEVAPEDMREPRSPPQVYKPSLGILPEAPSFEKSSSSHESVEEVGDADSPIRQSPSSTSSPRFSPFMRSAGTQDRFKDIGADWMA